MGPKLKKIVGFSLAGFEKTKDVKKMFKNAWNAYFFALKGQRSILQLQNGQKSQKAPLSLYGGWRGSRRSQMGSQSGSQNFPKQGGGERGLCAHGLHQSSWKKAKQI